MQWLGNWSRVSQSPWDSRVIFSQDSQGNLEEWRHEGGTRLAFTAKHGSVTLGDETRSLYMWSTILHAITGSAVFCVGICI